MSSDTTGEKLVNDGKIPLSQIPTPMKDLFNNSALSESIVFKTPVAS